MGKATKRTDDSQTTTAAAVRQKQGEREKYLQFSQKPHRKTNLSKSAEKAERASRLLSPAELSASVLLVVSAIAILYWIVVLLNPAGNETL